MEPIDVAYQKLLEFLNEDYPKCWDSLHTEADVRMKVIDRIFVEILGWPREYIHLEDAAGGGFIDYKCTINALARLIIEAKKDARDLGITKDYSGRFFRLDGAVFRSEFAQEGILQAVRYCGHKNAELACVTNGRQWIVFRGNRLGDGKDTLSGLACVFGSLEGVKEDFRRFYDLLAFSSVGNYRYRPEFQQAEGQPLRASLFRKELRSPASRRLLASDKLSNDVDRVMLSFFQTLTAEDDPELLRECFVTSPESYRAEDTLARISEDLVTRIQTLHTKEGNELTDAIRRVTEMNRHEFVVIVGTKGAGKSTFIDRFFTIVLPQPLAAQCVVMRVDLADSTGEEATIVQWLDQHLLEVAENAVFGIDSPTYEDLQGMFWDEYQRWRVGPYKHLYESNKDDFKTRFGEHIETRRETRPHEYIMRLLQRVVRSDRKVPCLVLDNADHFTIAFQENVFQYALSLFTQQLCLVLVPITDKTSWQLSRQGALQSFFTDCLFLPTPATQAVILKRIQYITKRLTHEKPEIGTGYFFGRGIPLSIGNLKAFANCLQEVFIKTGQVAEWIGNLANRDIRRSLKLTREIIGSPYIKVYELVTAWMDKTTIDVNPEDVKLAIVRARYDIYPSGQHEFVQNIYALTTEIDTTPLLGVRILQYLSDTRFQKVDGVTEFVEVGSLLEYFAAMHLERETVRRWLDSLLKSGLCLSYDPTSKNIDETSLIEVSPAGRQHLLWATSDLVYNDAMIQVTPLLDSVVYGQLQELDGLGTPMARRQAVRLFIEYILDEDRKYCVTPDHDAYAAQSQIAKAFARAIVAITRSPVRLSESPRFGRPSGVVVAWRRDDGYGFIESRVSPNDIFVHVSEVETFDKDYVEVGTEVVFDIYKSEKGLQAVNVAIISVPSR